MLVLYMVNKNNFKTEVDISLWLLTDWLTEQPSNQLTPISTFLRNRYSASQETLKILWN